MSALATSTSRAPDARRASDVLIVAVLVVAAVAVVVAIGGLWVYKTIPGAQRPAPEMWPTTTTLSRAHDKPTLVLFAHPRCTCTRATLEELRRLVTELPARFSTTIVFAAPELVDEQFDAIDNVVSAGSIRGATVVRDVGDVEAARFGADTSGHVVMYDRDGVLVFRGGITNSRGHVGDSAGGERLRALLTAARPNTVAEARTAVPVFGCDLQEKP